MTFLFRWEVRDDGYRLVWGILAFGVLAASAMYAWHSKKLVEAISDQADWAAVIGLLFLAGAVSFGIDMIIGSINNPGLSPIDAGTRAGSPFGFPLTIFLCPGVTFIATSGLIRSYLVKPKTFDG